MGHFMRQCGKNFLVGAPAKTVRAQRHFVHGGVLDAPNKTLGAEITFGSRMTLQRHQDVRQNAGEQLHVEKIIRFLESPVLSGRDGF
jgi:hypothetical protein